MWEALGFMAAGIGVSMIGRHYRKQYLREFDERRASSDPLYSSNASLMRRLVAVFLTSGAMMVLLGGYVALTEAWNFLRRG